MTAVNQNQSKIQQTQNENKQTSENELPKLNSKRMERAVQIKKMHQKHEEFLYNAEFRHLHVKTQTVSKFWSTYSYRFIYQAIMSQLLGVQ